MGDISSQHVWSINCSQGAKQLRRMKTYDVSDEGSVEVRNAVGSDTPIGFVFKPGGKTITFEYYSEKPKPEIDWRKLHNARETFALTRQIVGGQRVQYPECQVSKIGPSGDDEGEHMISVEIVALSEKAL